MTALDADSTIKRAEYRSLPPLSKGLFGRTAGMGGILTVDTMYEASRSRRECRISNGDGKLVINTIPVPVRNLA